MLNISNNFLPLGEIAPVGPTSFEFVLPEDAPITISPSVGTIQPGEVRLSQKLLEKKMFTSFSYQNTLLIWGSY